MSVSKVLKQLADAKTTPVVVEDPQHPVKLDATGAFWLTQAAALTSQVADQPRIMKNRTGEKSPQSSSSLADRGYRGQSGLRMGSGIGAH